MTKFQLCRGGFTCPVNGGKTLTYKYTSGIINPIMSYYDPESRWAHLSTKPGSDLLHQPLPADWRHLLSVEQLHELMTVIAQAVRIIDIQYIPTLPNYADIAYEILQQH